MQQSNPIRLIAGLGNPGEEYAGTRHNAGFDVITRLLRKLPGTFAESHRCESRLFSGRFRGRNLELQMPLTYMNLSGKAVRGIAAKLGIAPEAILIISDDLDLPVGRIRMRRGGSDGGHNGLKSIIAHLASEEFPRIKIGVGKKPTPDYDLVNWVLGRFPDSDIATLNEEFSSVFDSTSLILDGKIEDAMCKYSK